MAFLPTLRPRRFDYAFVFIRLGTISFVGAQLGQISSNIRDYSSSRDMTDIAIFALYTARLFNLAAFVPTFLACYLRPATLRRWSLAIGILCGINFGSTVAIQTRVPETMKSMASYDVAMAFLMMVIQAIYLGIPWLSYGSADYDEPVLRPETLNAGFEDDSVPLDRNAQESRVRSFKCSLPSLPQIGPLPSSRWHTLNRYSHCVQTGGTAPVAAIMRVSSCSLIYPGISVWRETDPLTSNSTVTVPNSILPSNIGPNTRSFLRSKAG